jgi:hypothetical protein
VAAVGGDAIGADSMHDEDHGAVTASWAKKLRGWLEAVEWHQKSACLPELTPEVLAKFITTTGSIGEGLHVLFACPCGGKAQLQHGKTMKKRNEFMSAAGKCHWGAGIHVAYLGERFSLCSAGSAVRMGLLCVADGIVNGTIDVFGTAMKPILGPGMSEESVHSMSTVVGSHHETSNAVAAGGSVCLGTSTSAPGVTAAGNIATMPVSEDISVEIENDNADSLQQSVHSHYEKRRGFQAPSAAWDFGTFKALW